MQIQYEVAPLEDITPTHFHRQMDINVLGPLQVTQAASKHLGTGGSVINIGSLVSVLAPPGMAVHSAIKGALDAITGVLAAELGPRGIRVNSIKPGMVDTEGAQTAGFVGSDFQVQLVARTPLGRIAAPDDIAAIAVFLASDDVRWVKGEQIKAGGGFKLDPANAESAPSADSADECFYGKAWSAEFICQTSPLATTSRRWLSGTFSPFRCHMCLRSWHSVKT